MAKLLNLVTYHCINCTEPVSVAWYLSWVDHLGGVRVALGAPRPRQQTPTRRTTTGSFKYASKFGPRPRHRRAAQPTSGGSDRLHNIANSLGVAEAFRRRPSSQQNLEFSNVQRRHSQRQSIHLKPNAPHGIQPRPCTTHWPR